MTELIVAFRNLDKAPEKLEVRKSLTTVEPSFFVLENKPIIYSLNSEKLL